MNIHIKAEGQTHPSAFLGFTYSCKKCGHMNESIRLNPFNNSFITLTINETQHEMLCHKCDDVEKFTVQIEGAMS